MQSVLLGLVALACPVGMGLMMWLMMRGHDPNTTSTADATSQQLDELRAEIKRLKAERVAEHPVDGP
jgi:hypothetical protein